MAKTQRTTDTVTMNGVTFMFNSDAHHASYRAFRGVPRRALNTVLTDWAAKHPDRVTAQNVVCASKYTSGDAVCGILSVNGDYIDSGGNVVVIIHMDDYPYPVINFSHLLQWRDELAQRETKW